MSFRRIAGYAGAATVLLIVVTQFVTGQPPDTDARAADIMEYYAGFDGWKSALTINMLVGPLIALFTAGVYSIARDGRRDDARPWAVVALIGTISSFASVFLISAADIVLAFRGGALSPEVVEAFWTLINVGFAYQIASLTISLLGFAMLTLRGGIGPRWVGLFAAVGAAAALLGSLATPMAIEDGSPLVFVGYLGFLAWLLWMATVSAWMVRTADDANDATV